MEIGKPISNYFILLWKSKEKKQYLITLEIEIYVMVVN